MLVHQLILTYMEAESSTLVVVGTVGDRSGGSPQSLASVCILPVFFKQAQVLEKLYPLANNHHLHFLEMSLLFTIIILNSSNKSILVYSPPAPAVQLQ